MSVRLFVLGVVYEHDAHGYEVKAAAKLWGVERWAKIGFGSIYHALGALEREGHIETLAVEREGSRPTRTVYRVTEAGRTSFLAMLRDALRSLERIDVDLALAFVANLPPPERSALLRQRLERLRSEVGSRESFERVQTELRHVPWALASVEHHRLLLQTEILWTEDLVQKVESFPTRDWAHLRLPSASSPSPRSSRRRLAFAIPASRSSEYASTTRKAFDAPTRSSESSEWSG